MALEYDSWWCLGKTILFGISIWSWLSSFVYEQNPLNSPLYIYKDGTYWMVLDTHHYEPIPRSRSLK